jgi:hypothetical protein
MPKKEVCMSPRLVVGLFRSSGIAEDARNRLKTEGLAVSEIALKVLKPTAPLHPTSGPELEALTVDPLTFGDVQQTFARFVRNGETVVCVRAASDEEAEFAADTLRQYEPIAINVLSFSSELNLSNPTPDGTRISAEARNRPLKKTVNCAV